MSEPTFPLWFCNLCGLTATAGNTWTPSPWHTCRDGIITELNKNEAAKMFMYNINAWHELQASRRKVRAAMAAVNWDEKYVYDRG